MTEKRWITVPNWGRFQHYGSARRPTWIKNYVSLLQKDEYLDLPLAARGLLHGIWLAYADRDGRLRCEDLPATLLARAREVHLASLNHAGLIDFSASKPLSLSLENQEVRARVKGEPDRDVRRARAWIRNGAAAAIPPGRLAEVLQDEYNLNDARVVDELVAQAQEWTNT